MSNLNKYFIVFILGIVMLIGYLVRKEINNQSVNEIKTEDNKKITSNISMDENSIKEQEKKDIETLRSMSDVNLTPDDIQNLNETAKFLEFKQRFEKIFAQKKPYVEPKEFNVLMKEVDRLQKEQYFFLVEAHAMKLELLKTQYSGEQLNIKIDELVAETQSIDKSEREKYDPLNDPKFRLLKEQEKRIIAQADLMKNYPNGLTKDEYIEQQIRAIY